MAKTENARHYRMPDATLIQRADSLENKMIRDAAAFALRGVTGTRRQTLVDARNLFSDYPTDIELHGDVMMATTAKETLRANLFVAVRKVRNMVQTKYGSAGIYRTFGFVGMDDLNDNEVVRLGRRVLRLVQMPEADITSEGFTAGLTADIDVLTKDFDLAIDQASAAAEIRDIYSQQRVVLGNALFARFREFALIGQSIFEDTDEARYNDYLIDDAPGGD